MANRAPNRLCHLSLLNQKQTVELVHFFEESRIKWEDFPPSCAVYFALFALLEFDLFSHLVTVSGSYPLKWQINGVFAISSINDNLWNLQCVTAVNTLVLLHLRHFYFDLNTVCVESQILNSLQSNPSPHTHTRSHTHLHTPPDYLRAEGTGNITKQQAQLQSSLETIPHFNESPVSPASGKCSTWLYLWNNYTVTIKGSCL